MYGHFGRGWLRAVTSFRLVTLWVHPEGESVTDNILSVTLIIYIYIHIRVHRLIHIPRDILLPVYVYLLYLLDGTAAAWMKSLVFIHLTQLPSNPILFGFGQLALRCDFSKTKIQPLTILVITLSMHHWIKAALGVFALNWQQFGTSVLAREWLVTSRVSESCYQEGSRRVMKPHRWLS